MLKWKKTSSFLESQCIVDYRIAVKLKPIPHWQMQQDVLYRRLGRYEYV